MDFTFHPGVNGTSPWVEFYPYVPSKPAGYAFMALFGISTVAHFVLMFPYRAAYFIPLLLGGICKLTNSPSPQNSDADEEQARHLATTAALGLMKIERILDHGPCRTF